MSERQACSVIGAERTSIRYRSRCPDNADLRERLRELASERCRFGYRRLHVLLRREGIIVNRKAYAERHLQSLQFEDASSTFRWMKLGGHRKLARADPA